MSAASPQLCGALAADKLEKPPAALGNLGEPSPGRGCTGRGRAGGFLRRCEQRIGDQCGRGRDARRAGLRRPAGGEEYTDLLSWGSFPLHTLNHHPNAPVLLRMLQLDNCSMGRASFPSRSLDGQAAVQPRCWARPARFCRGLRQTLTGEVRAGEVTHFAGRSGSGCGQGLSQAPAESCRSCPAPRAHCTRRAGSRRCWRGRS